jgi:hypothetical protein
MFKSTKLINARVAAFAFIDNLDHPISKYFKFVCSTLSKYPIYWVYVNKILYPQNFHSTGCFVSTFKQIKEKRSNWWSSYDGNSGSIECQKWVRGEYFSELSDILSATQFVFYTKDEIVPTSQPL